MPRLENIERFKEILYSLGSEPEINAQSSEAREDDVGPEAAAGEGSPSGTEGGFGLEAAPDMGLDSGGALGADDLPALGLDDLFGEGHEVSPSPEPEPEAAPSAEEEVEAGPGFDGEAGGGEGLDSLGLGDLFGESGGEGEEPLPGEPSAGAEGEAEGGEGGLADAFFMPDLGLEEGREEPPAGLGGEEAAPFAPEAGEAEAPEGSAAGLDAFAETPTEAPAGGEEGEDGFVDAFADALGGAPTGAPEEPAPADEPDLGGLPAGEEGFGEDLPEPPTEGAAPAGEAGDFGAETFDVGTLGAEDLGAGGADEEPESSEPGASAPDTFDPFALDVGSFEAEGEQGAPEPGVEIGGDAELAPIGAEAEAEIEATPEGSGEAAAGAEAETFDIDSFDSSSFGSELGTEEVPSTPSAEGGLGDAIDQLAEGFSLEGLTEGTEEESAGLEGGAEEEAPEGEGEAPEGPAELTLEDREFRAIQRNLETLPRNLKIAIETLVGEQAYSGEGLRPLLDLLIRGASPQSIAANVGKITGRTIRIPARFERQTGAEFEEEKRSFAYVFRKTVLPLLRTFLIVAAAAAALSYVGYEGVYKPLHARALYRAGYQAIGDGRYDDSKQSFGKAVAVRRVKGWYYRYADAYTAAGQYKRADQMYQDLDEAYRNDRKGLLDRAHLLSTKLANYPSAEQLLNRVTDKDYFDKDALLGLGDNYLEWARNAPVAATKEGERTRGDLLEAARLQFARLLEHYGYEDEVLFRMMRYFVRSDDLSEVQDLRAYLEGNEEFKPDPEVYAEVGGYLLDQGETEEARTVLLKAEAVGTEVPELDYNLARLYLTIDEPAEEGKALRNSLLSLGRAEKTPERLFMSIDVHRRYGRWLYRREEYLDSAKEFQTAISETEEALASKILSARPELGLPYEGLGDIRYYIESDYPAALELYTEARDQGIEDPTLDYRIGYVHFARGDFAKALAELVPVQEELPANWNVLFALGTTLHQRRDYAAAVGIYRRLLERLQDMRASITEMKPDVNPVHFRLANMLTKTHNNLGVSYYKQAHVKGGRGIELTRALVEVTEASQYLDLLSRDPETLARSEAKNLAYLNASAIQHPTSGFEPTIYDRMPKDTAAERF